MRKLFRIIIIFLNILAAVSLALAYLCCFVNPETIWWIGFFGLAYMYILLINICFILFWALSRKKIWILISTVTVLAGWSFVGKNLQLFEKEISDEEMENSFKILSFNVQGFTQRNTVQHDGEMVNIFDFFQEEDADIICLQEYSVNQWKKEDLKEENVRKQLNKTPFYHSEISRNRSGIATFSKYPIIRKELVYADKSNNACMCSDLLIGADTVRVYNVHLKSVGLQDEQLELLYDVEINEYEWADVYTVKSMIRQMKSSSLVRAQQVKILSSHIAQSPYPVIICGDFNEPPTSFSYRKVRGNLNDAFVESGAGRSATFDVGRIASLRIDYILYSDVFKAYDYEMQRIVLSDHFPVMCRLVKESPENRVTTHKSE